MVAGAPSIPANPTRRVALGGCCAIHALQDGFIATMYVLLPLLAQTFGLGYAQVGAIRALHASALSLLEIPSGILAERCGERPLLVMGMFLGGSGYLLLSMADGVVAIGACLFIAGVGGAFQHALSSSVISHSFEGSAPRGALGTYNSAGDVGKLAFTGMFSLALAVGLTWQQVVTGYGALGVLAALTVLALFTRHGVGSRRDTASTTTRRAAGWGIRSRGAFATLMIIVFLDISVQTGFLTFLAFLMLDKAVPTGLASFAVVLTLTGGIFGKFGCGFLADRLGIRRSLAIVEIACALAIVAVALAPALLAFALLPLLGVVLQGSSSITYATVADLVDKDRHSRAFAMAYTVSALAAIAAPVLFGAIADGFGLTATMLTMALVVLAPVPLSAGLRLREAHARA